jgi:transposase InsO family protein
VLGQSRSTQRHEGSIRDDESSLVARIIELAKRYGRYGYRRITALLRLEGWHVNHKRVKRGRLWLNDGSCIRRCPGYRNRVWAYDFVADRTHDGRPLKILTVVDEYTRECLAIEVHRRMRSIDVLQVLSRLFVERGAPRYIRSDNGPELKATLLRRWREQPEIQTLFIEPGSPWENGYVESFNGKFRDELLDREIFYTLKEARVLIERWRWEYNTIRTHSSLGYRPPAPETIAPLPPGSATLRPAATPGLS